MTKDEAKKIKDAARLYGKAEYDSGTALQDIGEPEGSWLGFTTLIDSMTDKKPSSSVEGIFVSYLINGE